MRIHYSLYKNYLICLNIDHVSAYVVAGAISQIFDLINHVDVNLEDHDYSLALA